MRSRIGLLLLALAGLAMGVPMVMGMQSGGSAGASSTDAAAGAARSALPSLGVWLLAGAVALGVGVLAMSLTRLTPVAHRSPAEAPAPVSDPQSAAV